MDKVNRNALERWVNGKRGVVESTQEMLGRVALAIEHLAEVIDYGFEGNDLEPGAVEKISMSLSEVVDAINSVAGAVEDKEG